MSEQRPDRPGPKRNRPGLGNGGMKFGRGLLGWLLFVAVAALLFVWLKQTSPGYAKIDFTNFWQQVEGSNVKSLVIDGSEITGKLKEQRTFGDQNVTNFHTDLPDGMGTQWEFLKDILQKTSNTTQIKAEPTNNILVNFILPFI